LSLSDTLIAFVASTNLYSNINIGAIQVQLATEKDMGHEICLISVVYAPTQANLKQQISMKSHKGYDPMRRKKI